MLVKPAPSAPDTLLDVRLLDVKIPFNHAMHPKITSYVTKATIEMCPFRITETDAEIEARIDKWDKYLEQEEEKKGQGIKGSNEAQKAAQ